MDWFEVDREGLRNLLGRKNKSFVVCELIQNGLDQAGTTKLEVRLEKIPRKLGRALLTVVDNDPTGFADLSHAFTLFADTAKRSNPTQRGRFNIGEKLVLALCHEATIASTTGTVKFDKSGRRRGTGRRAEGSSFVGEISMNQDDLCEAGILVGLILPPKHVDLTFNGHSIPWREPLATIEATLPTEIADPGEPLRKTARKTTIEIHDADGEAATIYEMGIPIVETGDKFHVNIMQKVPLNMERDNVTPAFLQTIRSLVLNETFDRIDEDAINDDWVRAATSDKRCSGKAMSKAMDLRFGTKRVSFDPSDHEANMLAVSKGFTVVKGAQMSKTEWQNARDAKTILPAGKVTPAKPQFTDVAPDVSEDCLTDGMRAVREYSIMLAHELMGVTLGVRFLDGKGFAATYSRCGDNNGKLVYYVPVLGRKWFDLEANIVPIDDLIIHEFGHQYSRNHLESKYHEALSRLGAKLKALCLRSPGRF